jgi:branched-chain amino acid transport system permease protein
MGGSGPEPPIYNLSDVYLHLVAQALAIGLLTGILYVLVALGLTLIYGILHIVNFAHGEIYMLGAMAVFYLYVVFKLPFAATLVAILLLSVLVGLVVERTIFRSLRGQWLQLVVASVGLSLIIQSLAWVAFGIQEKNVPSTFTGVVSLAGIRLPMERLVAAAVGVVLVAVLYVLVYRTKVGLAMRAIEEDEETARMLGINADRVAALACAIGFALAALAGAFVAPIYSLNPGMGLEAILMSFLIIIVGGLGSITGTVLAGLLVGVIQSVGAVLFGAEAAYGLVFVVMILVLVFRPSGLLGKA